METILSSFQFAAAHHISFAYILLFSGSIFLGNIAIWPGLWLAFQGFFGEHSIANAIAVILIADLTADILWYWTGRGLSGTPLGFYIKRKIPKTERIENHMRTNSRRWIFLSKFMYGATFPIIFCAGWSRAHFPKFIRTSLVAIALWLAFAVATCYLIFHIMSIFHGAIFLKRIEMVVGVSVVGYLLMHYLVNKFLVPRLSKEPAE